MMWSGCTVTLCILIQVNEIAEAMNGYTISTLIVFGYSFFVASFILFLVQEKENKVNCNYMQHT